MASLDSDNDEEHMESVPKKQSVAKAKPAAKPTRGDFILHFVTLAQCNLLGVVSVAVAKAAAPKAVLKKKDSDSDEEEKDAPTRQRKSRGELCLLVVLVVLVEVC